MTTERTGGGLFVVRKLLSPRHDRNGLLTPDQTSLADNLETLTAVEIQQRFAAEDIDCTLDFAALLRDEAIAEAEARALTRSNAHHEVHGAAVDPHDGATHDSSVGQQGGAA